MLLVDSSVWIEDLRSIGQDTRSTRFGVLKRERADELAITEPVLIEVLAGARDLDLVRGRLSVLPLRRVDPNRDYEAAAVVYRVARGRGRTVRSLNDCLIAAVALRLDDVVVHRDEDFAVLADCVGLHTLDLR